MLRTTTVLSLAVWLLAAASAPAAAQSHIVNGSVTTQTAGGSLGADLAAIAARERGVVWVGYAVPANKAGQEACCREYRGNAPVSECCRLERGADHTVRTGTDSGKARLEPSTDLGVFIRFEAGVFSRAAAFSQDCEIDAGGKRVVWLTGVKPADSLVWLAAQATKDAADTRGRDGVIMAVAFHADSAADRALERLALSGPSRKVQQSAAFWMGAARDAAGFAGLKRVLTQVTDTKLREHVVFAVSVSKEAGALDLLLDLARNDRQPQVRGQALFWLGQKAGARVADTIVSALQNDPDTEVKKRAVFALSQLPKDEGIPKLIDIARTNKNPEVRKQAMFWLGQSKDPRALTFFEAVLTGK
ncbi:MAG: HEAT repeat domain-containing protein [Vicinamibacterales bacterium]|nr:HEAT repeat domain-containing protein [Vicinamibacterales bacterium]